MSNPFGTIQYRGAGTFIAGGAGITPFLAILRELAGKNSLTDHQLVFANKTPMDVICEKELRAYLGDRGHFITTSSKAPGYEQRRIDAAYLQDTVGSKKQNFYLCGPPGFMESVTEALKSFGADPQALVFEA